MPRKSLSKTSSAHIALCYVRLSWTKNESDADSPERQRANIQFVCDAHGWTPEWYEDAEGHKTGTKEKNRPGWLALKARLGDADVIALVANDLSRLHRKGWRVGDLLDFVDDHDVKLLLAAPGKQMDFSTPQGRIFAQLSAIFDEWYAIDISQRYKDMIAHRKRQGKGVGLPPFGTRRDDTGYLVPTHEGAWYLADGTFAAGNVNEQPPAPEAVWRSYYEAAKRILTLYAEGSHGIEAIAYRMQIEGWPWRDRSGVPTVMEGDDVRRVVANWPEYGGFVSKFRARERHPDDYPVETIRLNAERAVFDLDLLYRIGQVRAERTIKHTINDGEKVESFPYPLNGITYCYHCELLAQQHNNPKLRSRLGGKGRHQEGRYRHKSGVQCGCTNKSVKRTIYERDLGRLLQLLTVDTDQIEFMTRLGVQALTAHEKTQCEDIEHQKRTAIAKCRRRIEAARHLYEDGDLSREEYLKRKDANEREIVHWEAQTVETEKIALELTLCLEAIDRINQLWEISDDEDKQGMARNLFSSITYNLDTQRIVDFKLKPWADRFIMLRSALYQDEIASVEGKQNPLNVVQGVGKGMTPRGCRTYPRYVAIEFRLRRRRRMSSPQNANSQKPQIRDHALVLRNQGLSYPAIAHQLGISVGTAWNLVNN